VSAHLFSHATARDLGVLRTAVFGIWLVIIFFTPITSYTSLPASLFEPLGIYRLLLGSGDGAVMQFILTEGFLVFLKMALLAGCLLCMIGIRPFRWIAVPTVALLFLADAITKGFNGFVNHAELGILYASLVLVMFPSADGFTPFKKKKSAAGKASDTNYVAPILTIAFILCMAYTFIGVHRLLYGGMEQFFNHAMEVHLLVNSYNYSKYGFGLGLWVVSSDWLMILFKTGFFAITLFEITALFAIINRTFAYIWMAVIIPFHFLSLFTMNIFFWENTVLILVLFLVVSRELSRELSLGIRQTR